MTNEASVLHKHTQPGYVTGLTMLGGALLVSYLFMAGSGALSLAGYVLACPFVLLAVLFFSLTVVVDDRELSFYFGPGFWKRSFALADIRSVKVVRNPVYYGWGIRWTFHGWLYNVSGAGHDVHIDQLDTLLEELRAFLGTR